MRKSRSKRNRRLEEGSGQINIWPILFVFLAGLLVLLYPTISELWNRQFQHEEIEHYDESVVQMKEAKKQAALDEVRNYNAGLLKSEAMLTDPFDPSALSEDDTQYEKLLADMKMMGYLRVPAIDLELPIYHGTSDDVLAKAVGHLKGSSLPVGGKGTHCVLSAHNGLPTATLFTNLDKLDRGDWFCITVMDEKLYYRIDQIQVVEPKDTDPLAIDPQQDYVTLVTCTPYGVNSHRLLVRGVRAYDIVEEDETAKKSAVSHLSLSRIMRGILYAIAIAIIVIFFVVLLRGNKEEEEQEIWQKPERRRSSKRQGTPQIWQNMKNCLTPKPKRRKRRQHSRNRRKKSRNPGQSRNRQQQRKRNS